MMHPLQSDQPTEPAPNSRRIDSLECLRGLAAMAVIAWHLMLAFAPRYSGIFPDSAPFLLTGHPWSGFINGSASVSFFFVLSGFVLPWAYFHSGNTGVITRGILKRWPRLAGACFIVIMISFFMYVSNLYFFREAGAISGSPWLKDFAYSGLSQTFTPTFGGALKQGLFKVFFTGETFYDTSLWTMHPEFLGSIISLLIAPVLLHIRKPLVLIILTVALGYLLAALNPHIPEFLVGTFLARILYNRTLHIRPFLAFAMIALAYIMLSFLGAKGVFTRLQFVGITNAALYPWVWAPASVLLIVGTLGCSRINNLLSGKWAQFLGRMSFPIYLIHVPIICSLGSWVYITCCGVWPSSYAAALAALSVFLTTFLLAVPLSIFDQWWLKKVGHASRRWAESNR